MQIIITINTENAAFEDYPQGEVSRILQELARDVRNLPMYEEDSPLRDGGLKLRDANGNTVGDVRILEGD